MNVHDLRVLHAECLSFEGGFLPRLVPPDVLPAPLRAYSDATAELPDRYHGLDKSVGPWLEARFGHADDAAAAAAAIDTLDEAHLDKAFAVLSVLGHAYRWDRAPAPQARYGIGAMEVPIGLRAPWQRCAERLGVPCVGNLYSMVLCNWRMPGRAATPYHNAELQAESLVLAHPWLRAPEVDELACFLMTAIETEARGALAVRTLLDLLEAVTTEAVSEVHFLLDRLLFELDQMSRPFRNNIQRKKISPDAFLTLIQPTTIWGLPEHPGGEPLEGASGPQVGSVQCIDALLGAGHDRPISQAILRSRRYMPARHRAFVAAVEASVAPVREFVLHSGDAQSQRLFNACVEGIVGWRRVHERRGAMYLRGEKAGEGAYTSTGGVVALADERVRVFEKAMVERQDEVLAAAVPVAERSADDELANALNHLTPEDRAAMLEGAERRSIEADEVLIQAGARREGLYLLRRGAVRVVRPRAGEPVVIARIGAGALFGEMSFFENEDASASVEAECPCEIAVVPREHIYAMFRARAGLATRFYQSLASLVAHRLRDTTRRLADDGKPPASAARGLSADVSAGAEPQAARAARAAGRLFCDALETLEEVADDRDSLDSGLRRAGQQLLADCRTLNAPTVVRHAWPRLSESALVRTLSELAPGVELEAELAARLAGPADGLGAVGCAVDVWLRSLPTLSGFLNLGGALADTLTAKLRGAEAPRVLALVPAFGPRLLAAVGALGGTLTVVHPESAACEAVRATARRLGLQGALRLVPEPVARLRRQAVETFWRPFDAVVADGLLLNVADDDTEPLLDWILSLLRPGGHALFGAAQPGAPERDFLRAVGRWPACERTDADVLATLVETQGTACALEWHDAARAWCIASARRRGTPDAPG